MDGIRWYLPMFMLRSYAHDRILRASGGCIAQDGNRTAVVEMTRRRVAARVNPELHGNCVLDFEGWNSVVPAPLRNVNDAKT